MKSDVRNATSHLEAGALSPLDVLKVTTPSQKVLLTDLESRLATRQGFAVATVNLDHMVKLRREPIFREAYARHSHIVADGNPIVWLHWLAGRPVSLVPGSDLVLPLAALAAKLKVPVALLGATGETLEIAAMRLRDVYPDLLIVACIPLSFGVDPSGPEAGACLAAVGTAGARLCLVALGAPKQEIFAARGMQQLPECGFVSVGAGLDFIAGTQRRAPLWLRKLTLEWLWRLTGDWRRLWRRYRDCALILPGLAVIALRHRLSGDLRAGAGL